MASKRPNWPGLPLQNETNLGQPTKQSSTPRGGAPQAAVTSHRASHRSAIMDEAKQRPNSANMGPNMAKLSRRQTSLGPCRVEGAKTRDNSAIAETWSKTAKFFNRNSRTQIWPCLDGNRNPPTLPQIRQASGKLLEGNRRPFGQPRERLD